MSIKDVATSTATKIQTSSLLNTVKDKASRFSLKTTGSRKSAELEGYASIETNGVPVHDQTMSCEVKITCVNAKKLQDGIVAAIKTAIRDFIDGTELCGNIKTHLDEAANHNAALDVVAEITTAKNNFVSNHNTFLKKIADKMTLRTPITGKVSTSSGMFSSKKIFYNCEIVAIRPKDKTVFITWTDDKNKKHDIAVPIAKVCIGGDDGVGIPSGKKCDLAHGQLNDMPATGGARKKTTKRRKLDDSSMSDGGICE